MGRALVVVGKRRWTDLESRLAASLVYRALRRVGRPVTLDELIKESGVDREEVLHAIGWMRGHRVDLRVRPGRRGVEESTLELVEHGDDHVERP